ncbi:MAG: NAD(P)/FAD-dependent oxidoreductase [Ornithinimicrobium sp.]|jgi:NADPH-dependent 2,4-dienoyl-CoA reductase/sulfur reductase-like enzyme|uniref:NAD(P)/FAD-dependent oxidoreductase n=1 Tax=Ornithinimicrobium sp. TaxID=1977084 RepID=UPI003D9B72B3
MDRYGLVVIGSGPGGVGAATAYLEAGGATPVLVVTSDEDPPYMRPPLSKESLRSSQEPEPTPLADDLGKVELRLGTTVSHLDLEARSVQAGAETVGFDRLVIATGARPMSLPGIDSEVDQHQLRTLADLRRLHEAAGHARSAVVIGSGFIGCEAAASLAMRGLDVTMATREEAPQQARLGEHVAGAITGWLRGYGVTMHTGVDVSSVEPPRQVHLSDGTTLEPDLLLVVVGVEPATDALDGSGLELEQGRVVVDQRLQTATDGVYAVGDVALAEHQVAGRRVVVEHWGDAEAMGEVAGQAAAGQDVVWETIPGFWSEIGEHTLMYAAWGDGYDRAEVVEGDDGFTVWYGDEHGALVGVLAYGTEDDYERGRELIEAGVSLAEALQRAGGRTGEAEAAKET